MGNITEYKKDLIHCTQSILSKMFDTETTVEEIEISKATIKQDSIGVAIRGQYNYGLYFHFSHDFAMHLWKQHESKQMPTETERIDFISEISNQIAGNIKRIISNQTDLDLYLSLPHIITKNYVILTMEEQDYESICFTCEQGRLILLFQSLTSTMKDTFMRFLIVDDAVFMRNMIRKALTSFGYSDFTEATSGDEAIKKVSEMQFDIILMDWNMPVPGIDAVKAIRKMGIKTPIVMVTTEGEKMKVIKAVQAGANNYLVKPFTPEQLKEKIDQVTKK